MEGLEGDNPAPRVDILSSGDSSVDQNDFKKTSKQVENISIKIQD